MTTEETIALAEKHGARITGKPDGSEAIEVVFPLAAWQAFSTALSQPAVPVPDVAKWVPVSLSDVPNGLTEIYPAERLYQFLAPRGDGSAKGNQAWLITLPPLPDTDQPVQPAPDVADKDARAMRFLLARIAEMEQAALHQALAQPTNTLRCKLCGGDVDFSAGGKPTLDYTMQGRVKPTPAAVPDVDSVMPVIAHMLFDAGGGSFVVYPGQLKHYAKWRTPQEPLVYLKDAQAAITALVRERDDAKQLATEYRDNGVRLMEVADSCKAALDDTRQRIAELEQEMDNAKQAIETAIAAMGTQPDHSGEAAEMVQAPAVVGVVWQPIATAPTDGTEIVGAEWQQSHEAEQPELHTASTRWRDEAWRYWSGCDWTPSHWMPLPEVPNAKGATE